MEHRYSRDSFYCHACASRRAGKAWYASLCGVLARRLRMLMKTDLSRLCGLLPTVALMAGVSASSAYGQNEIDSEALRQVALAIEQNYSSIQTWQLSAERFSESYNTAAPSSDDGLLRGRTIQRMSFFGDKVRGLFRSDVYGPEMNAAAAEGNRKEEGPAASSLAGKYEPFWRTLIKAEGEVFRYSGNHGEEQHGQLVIEQGTNATRRPDYFDPLECTGFVGKTGDSFREWLSFVADQVGKQHDFGIHVKREGDRVILHIEKKGEAGFNTYTFDLSRGGNLMAYHTGYKNIMTEISIAYEKRGGTWVPTEHVEKVVHKASASDPGKRWVTRTTLAKQRVNEPIDPLVFTVEGLGLLPGNTVVDRRYPSTPVVFEYSGEGGTPAWSLDHTVALITGKAGTQPSTDQGPAPLASSDKSALAASRPTSPPVLSEKRTALGDGATIFILIGILALVGVFAVWASRRKSGVVKM